MELSNIHINYYYRLLAILSFVIMLLSLQVTSNSCVVLCFVTSSVLTLSLLIKRHIYLEFTDIIVIFILLFDLVVEFILAKYNGGVPSLISSYSLTCFYFTIRSMCHSKSSTRLFLLLLTILCYVVTTLGIVSFFIFKHNVITCCGEYLSDYKFMYRPLGILNNVWNTLLIGFLGLSTLTLFNYRHNKLISRLIYLGLGFVIFEIIISFSRGTYFAFGVFVILICTYIITCRQRAVNKIAFIGIILIFIVTIASFFHKDVIRTCRITETISQQRSLNTRVNAFHLVLPAIKNNAIIGVGNGRYSLALNEYLFEDDNDSFTNFAPNILSQLVVERGILGSILWCLLVVGLGYKILLLRNRKERLLVIIIILPILVRELTFAVFFHHTGIQFVIITIIAIIMSLKTRSNALILNVDSKYFISSQFIILSIVLILFYNNHRNKISNEKMLGYIHSKQYEQAELCGNRLDDRVPFLINKSGLYWHLYKQTKDTPSLYKAKETILQTIKLNDKDMMLKHNLAVILAEENKIDSSLTILNTLVQQFPNNTTYRLSLGKLYYDQNDQKQCISHIVEAIKLTPTLLDTDFWQNMKMSDRALCNMIIMRLLSDINNKPTDPIKLAKYGKIALTFEDYNKAKDYFHEATTILPNLINPWAYLAVIAQQENNIDLYETYLKKVKFLTGNDNYDISTLFSNSLAMSSYFTKFITWYSSKTHIDLAILSIN